jgi:hypothetical protein
MSLLHRVSDVHAARQRAEDARRRWKDSTWPLRRRLRARPLLWVGMIGAGSVLAGWLVRHPPEGLRGLGNDPVLRWAVRLLAPGSGL